MHVCTGEQFEIMLNMSWLQPKIAYLQIAPMVKGTDRKGYIKFNLSVISYF